MSLTSDSFVCQNKNNQISHQYRILESIGPSVSMDQRLILFDYRNIKRAFSVQLKIKFKNNLMNE